MTLDEAIQHATEKAKNEKCRGCAEDHLQLVIWLEELKDLKIKKD